MRESSSIVVVGGRVLLARPTEADRSAWRELVSTSREFLVRWIQGAGVADDPDGDRWFDATLSASGDPRHEKLLVVREDGVLLGALNCNEIVRGSFQSAYLGYWIGQPHVRQGYMAEALALGLRHAFGPLRLHRVEANIQPDNAASIALVRSAGFVKEGVSERYLQVGGIWRDHERWALTVERWGG